jgi:putative ABC transport system permease protein
MGGRFASFLRNTFRRSAVERDLDEEMRAYLDLVAREKVEAGMDAAAAARAARLELGGVEQVKQEVRAARVGARLDDVVRDVRHGWRMLWRAPAFTSIALLTLALGIGANTAIFSVVDGVLLRPAPLSKLDELVVVWETDRASGTSREPASLPDFTDFRQRARSVSGLAAFVAGEVNLAAAAGDPRRVAAMAVTSELWPALGVAPILGRGFTPSEARPAGPRLAVISESLWAESYQRSPDVLGRIIRLDEEPHVVVGVMPEAADFGVLQILTRAAYARGFADRGAGGEVDVWTPLQAELPRSAHPIFVVGRLAAGHTRAAAQDELAAIAADLERTYPENEARGVFVEPLGDVVFAPVRPALTLLLGTVLLVLLVASVNVGNLIIARGATRAREVAVRTAVGATTFRLARQFLIENLLLALIAGAAGVALAHLGLELLLSIAPADVPRVGSIAVNARVLSFTLALSIAVGAVFGLLPALQARGVEIQSALRGDGGGQATAGRGRRRLRSALVVAELALAVVLVAGAALLVRSFWNLRDVDPGFRPDGVLKAELQLPAARYPFDLERPDANSRARAFTGELLARAAALPGVESAAMAGHHPLDPGFTSSFSVVGREGEAGSWPEISVRRVSAGYFETVRLPLVRGRALARGDETGEPVVVINRTAVDRFFAGREPLGAQIRMWGAARRIVGVVGDERLRGLAEAAPPAVYLPLARTLSWTGAYVLLVRAAGDPAALAPAVRGAIRKLDPQLAAFGVEPLDRTMARSVSQRRFVMLLLGLFAALALALAAIGVYGVLAYSVAQRTREIGIRLALGARPGALRRQIVRQGLLLAGTGVALGIAGAAALARLFQSMLFGVAPTDAATHVTVAAFLLIVALAASYLPARQATRVDPMTALRAE